MEPFEYVVVLTSLILGLGITQILIGIAEMVVRSGKSKFSVEHTLLIFIVFMMHIQEWWVSFQYSKQITEWKLTIVLVMLVYPILLFLMARILFPDGKQRNNLAKYYDDQWKRFFIVLMLISLTSLWQNWVLSDISVLSQIPQIAFTLVLLAFVVFKITNKAAHIVLMLAVTASWIYYIITDMNTLM